MEKWYEKEITWNDIKAFFSKVKPKTKSYNLNLEFLSGGKKPKITAHDRGKKMAECLPSGPKAVSKDNEYKTRAEKEARKMKEEFNKQKLLSIREYENYKRKAKTNMLDAQLEAKRYWDEIKRR